MSMYKGGTFVERGLYWSPVDGEQINMQQDGMLEGDESRTYMKISPAGLLLMAPLFGMMYVMFLPLLGIGVFIVSWLVIIIGAVGRVAMSGIQVCGRIIGRSTFFSWRPSNTYFSGAGKRQKADDKDKKR
jgi:hypothetical protein